MIKILIIDDDRSLADAIYLTLKAEGFKVYKAITMQDGKKLMQKHQPEIIISDLVLDEGTGLDLLKESRSLKKIPDFILMTGQATPDTAHEAIELGAYEYITKPFPQGELARICRNIHTRRELIKDLKTSRHNRTLNKPRIVYQSKSVKEIMQLAKDVAPRNTSVLLLGESGTGKEEIARFIHQHSKNPNGPYVAINCGAIPENLVASELFGHEKGAFTGADETRIGAFQRAENGTLLLDEIGDIPSQIQVHLLRALENREITPVGGTQSIPVNTRIIAATHHNLAQLIREGSFRQDLYFRLNVFPIQVPPLRERIDDIPHLASYFLEQLGEPPDIISQSCMEKLQEYHWPGNVRELRNVMENLVIRSRGNDITQGLLEAILTPLMDLMETPHEESPDISVLDYENEKIKTTLKKTKGNKSKAAKMLGISRSKLYAKIKDLGLEEYHG